MGGQGPDMTSNQMTQPTQRSGKRANGKSNCEQEDSMGVSEVGTRIYNSTDRMKTSENYDIGHMGTYSTNFF